MSFPNTLMLSSTFVNVWPVFLTVVLTSLSNSITCVISGPDSIHCFFFFFHYRQNPPVAWLIPDCQTLWNLISFKSPKRFWALFWDAADLLRKSLIFLGSVRWSLYAWANLAPLQRQSPSKDTPRCHTSWGFCSGCRGTWATPSPVLAAGLLCLLPSGGFTASRHDKITGTRFSLPSQDTEEYMKQWFFGHWTAGNRGQSSPREEKQWRRILHIPWLPACRLSDLGMGRKCPGRVWESS